MWERSTSTPTELLTAASKKLESKSRRSSPDRVLVGNNGLDACDLINEMILLAYLLIIDFDYYAFSNC